MQIQTRYFFFLFREQLKEMIKIHLTHIIKEYTFDGDGKKKTATKEITSSLNHMFLEFKVLKITICNFLTISI